VKEEIPDKGSETQILEELTRLLGHAPVDWSMETLTHNTLNAVTAGIWRVRAESLSAILKVVSPGGSAMLEEWRPSDETSHWNYWKREALAYESGLTSAYSEAGILGPRLLALNRRPKGDMALWLEDAKSGGSSVPGTRWGAETYRRFARSLGLAQGRIVVTEAVPDHPWLTKRFLRDYVLSKQVDRGVLYSDEAWQRPLVRDNFPNGLRRGLTRLHEEREWFFSLLERLPRTLCHLDVWPNNLFAREDGTFTLVDWSFVGEGALGEDVGNLVPDSVFDLVVPARDLPDLDREVFTGYVSGLREAGWKGDERAVRLGMCASAVKYEWLGPLMLQRASEARQLEYGGGEAADPSLLYAERGCALAFLAAWAEGARALSEELGYTR
jgi:hypothetical protein